jgi:branched-chain amino acid transport system ATP-binding protein
VSVAEREIVGVIGPNGAGKSTLMDAISGMVACEAGRVVVADRDVTALPPAERARAGLGRSFQHALLFPTLTVREAVAVALEVSLEPYGPLAAASWLPRVRAAERGVRRRVDHLIELVGLEQAADAYVSELSTAMRRIVDLACMTAMQPRALLLDEPSSGLAQAEAEELGPLLRRLVAETGCGLLIIEHDVPMLTSIADRMLAMDLGRVIAEGEPAAVIADEEVVRSALGARHDVIARSGRARYEADQTME